MDELPYELVAALADAIFHEMDNEGDASYRAAKAALQALQEAGYNVAKPFWPPGET